MYGVYIQQVLRVHAITQSHTWLLLTAYICNQFIRPVLELIGIQNNNFGNLLLFKLEEYNQFELPVAIRNGKYFFIRLKMLSTWKISVP